MRNIFAVFILAALCSASHAQDCVARIDTFGKVTGIPNAIYFEPESYPMFARLANGYELRLFPNFNAVPPEPIPETKKALPLEWRGAFLSFDAANRFSDRFSRMSYGVSASTMLGYKQYNFRAEFIAPLSEQAWLYRLRFEYQVF